MKQTTWSLNIQIFMQAGKISHNQQTRTRDSEMYTDFLSFSFSLLSSPHFNNYSRNIVPTIVLGRKKSSFLFVMTFQNNINVLNVHKGNGGG